MRTFIETKLGILAAIAAMAALPLAQSAHAQYAAYGQQAGVAAGQAYGQAAQPQYGQAAQPQYAQAPGTYAQAPPQYAQAGVYQGYAPSTGYVSPYAAPRVAMAYQTPGQAVAPNENLPLTAPADPAPAGVPSNGSYMPQPVASPEQYAAPMNGGYAAPGANGGCNCQGNGYTQGGSSSYESYPSDSSAYGACNPYNGYGSMNQCISPRANCGYWFGGVYGLLMDRDDSNKYALTFTAPPMPAGGYPANSQSVVLTTRNVDVGFQPGVEFRFGRTFGCGGDPCGCNCSCGPRWGLEGVYWTLFEEDDSAQYVDQGGIRTYSMMPMPGLEYDNGTGYRPVNDYWDYAPPAGPTSDIEIRLARVRSEFEVQNVEVNLLRLSLCGSGSAYNSGCGYDACAGGGCDGCGTGGYGSCTGSRFSCTGLLGFRYMQFDESFMYGVDFDNTGVGAPGSIDGFLNYWSTVKNDMIGAQLGCNGMYRIGCKWGIHMNTAVGLYGNDIDVRQYMVSPTNQVRYIATGENFDVNASKTDVSMLGELRLGASYQATCRCRLYGGWRAIGVTGIALATDQAPNQFIDATQLNGYVNSNGSMILHGLQAGVEWNY